jgi:hypothetical protein
VFAPSTIRFTGKEVDRFASPRRGRTELLTPLETLS